MNTSDPRVPLRRVYGGVRHEVRVAERRKAFIDAGIEVFGSIGFHDCTVRLICQQARLTDRYFYESFESLEALLIAVYEQLTTRLRERLATAFEGAEDALEPQAEAALTAFFLFMRHPAHARIMLVEILGVSPAVNRIWQRGNADFGALMVSAFRRFAPSCFQDADDERLLGQALVGSVAFAAASWMLSGYRLPVERLVENCQHVVLGTFRHRLSVPPRRHAGAA